MTKVLIEGAIRVIKLPRPTGVRAMGTTEIGVVDTVGPVAALGSSSMFVTAWQEQYVE